jgi:hypothetical protein
VTALAIDPSTPVPTPVNLQVVEATPTGSVLQCVEFSDGSLYGGDGRYISPPLSVFELGRLRLVDLQARYLQLIPEPRYGNKHHAGLVLALQLMTREQLIEHVLEDRR